MKDHHCGRSALCHIGVGALIVVAVAVVFGALVMFLWNALLPEILGVRTISYCQAIGLLLLTRILVGHFGHGPRGHFRRHPGHGDSTDGACGCWCHCRPAAGEANDPEPTPANPKSE